MPNTGRPSRDCHTCRQRRIKCDLTRPECNRCLSKGRSCPGYRDELDIRFRMESVSSFRSNMGRDRRRTSHRESDSYTLVERPPLRVAISPPGIDRTGRLPAKFIRHQAAFDRAGITSDTDLALRWTDLPEQTDGFPLTPERHTPLRYPLAESWNDHFMPLVMSKFSFGVTETIYNAIPRVVSKTEEGSALYLACRAVGCAYMANTTRSSKAISDRTRAYGTAITAVYSALRDPQQCKSDHTLLSVWLLSLYELLVGARDGVNSVVVSSEWNIHSQGLTELIRLRGPEHFARRDGRNLFWIVFNTVQIRALMTDRECPEETFAWIQEIYRHCDPVEYPIIRACIFSYHCGRLCSRIRRLLDAGDLDQLLSSSPSILRDMDEVEKATHPLSHEKPITDCVVEPPMTPYTGPDRIDLRYVGFYTYQSYFRMRLSSRILEFLSRASRAPSCTPQQRIIFTQFRHRCIEEFRALANKVLFILAITLDIDPPTLLDQLKGHDKGLSRIVEWPDAIRVLWPVVQWPLRLIAACPIPFDWQRDAANKVLDSMNKQLGVMRTLGTLYFSAMKYP